MDKSKSPSRTTPSGSARPPEKPAPASTPVPATKPKRLFRPIDWLTFLISTLLVMAGYFYTLAPDLTLEDSGELAVGSFYAGIPHPPGYPVWTIYTWVWTVILPFKNIAWRVAVGEAFGGALACGLLGFLVSRGSSMMMEGIAELKEIGRRWENAICVVSGTVAGLLLGFNGYMWSQSVIVEVYSFSVLSLMGVLLCLLRWIYAPFQRRYLYWAFFLFGICFTNHQSLIVAAMGIEVAIAAADYRMGRNFFLWNSIAFVAGLVLKKAGVIFTNTNPMVFTIFCFVGVLSIAAYVWFAMLTKETAMELSLDGALAGLFIFLICFLFFKPVRNVVGLFLVLGCLGGVIKLGWETRKKGLEWLVTFGCGWLWILGASFYLYMALAGMTNPPMQWGYPRTVEGFMHALTRGQYEKTNPADVFGDPLRVVGQLEMMFEGIVDEFNWVYTLVALVPFLFFFRMQKRERAWVIGIGAIYFCLGVLLLVLINPPPDRQARELIRVFFTASHVLIAMGVGYGLTLIASMAATHYRQMRVPMILAGVVAVDLALYSLGIGTHSLLVDDFAPESGILPVHLRIVFALASIVSLALIGLRIRRFEEGRAHEIMALVILGAVALGGLIIGVQSFRGSFAGVNEDTMTGLAKLFCWAIAGVCVYLQGQRQPGMGLPPLYGVAGLFALLAFGLTATGVMGDTGFGHFFSAFGRAFQPDQYALPVFGGLLLLGMTLAFLVGAIVWRQRAPLALMLVIFAVMPLHLFMAHWFANEQRGHLFGYWFGHDMFTPPFVGPDGEFSYDPKLREEMMKDPAQAKLIYPEMTRDAVLYGGTDPGRFCPTYMIFCESFIPPECKPLDPLFDRRDVYIITQNALADGTYLNYIRAHYNRSTQIDPPFFQEWLRTEKSRQNYTTNFLARLAAKWLDKPFTELGARIEKRRREEGVYPKNEMYIATPRDSERCFSEYINDAQRRLQLNQLRPGEDVRRVPDASGQERVQVSGQVAVMAINGLITKVMFDKNPTNEFFVEESFPLEWMYPHLTPFGIIMKINREPLPSLSEEILERDHKFWRKYAERFIGDWIDYDTPVSNIVAFVEKVHLRHDFSDFKGDRKFIRDDQSQKAFSKLRSSIGGVYAWRLGPQSDPRYRPKTTEEYQRLMKEADFTFRQAFAFCPYSPEAVFRYVQLLMQVNRLDDAILIAETCLKLDPYNGQVLGLVKNLRDIRTQSAQFEATRQSLAKMEAQYRTNPTDFALGLSIASAYFQMQQNVTAISLMDGMMKHPKVTQQVLMEIANAYLGMTNYAKLEETLDRLTQVSPNSPEIWYDHAGIKAFLGKVNEAFPSLERAIKLSNERLKANPGADDLLTQSRTDPRFVRLHGMPDFQRIVSGQ